MGRREGARKKKAERARQGVRESKKVLVKPCVYVQDKEKKRRLRKRQSRHERT